MTPSTLAAVDSDSLARWSEVGVAVGTLVLAVATGLLARGTKNLATRTADVAARTGEVAQRTAELAQEGRDDLRAQWRPVLVPVVDSLTQSVGASSTRLLFSLCNVGRGPALSVRLVLDFQPEVSGALGFGGWQHETVLAAGEKRELSVLLPPEIDRGFQLLLDYRDVARHDYATVVVIAESPAGGFFVYDVRTWADRSVTGQTGAAYPPFGLRNVGPPEDDRMTTTPAQDGKDS
ncbi:hypothetical protein [Streptomyces sp. NBC_00474]|uniref:hypothetical protein n=1 Tax=Streptomyces sp. NBC_00474 TaxID=2975754 RepID=UPI0022538F59|nr:hypothetical protein [Streptomyces sp. NBC_00474]MCX5055061.1 hypothetical protein [Streptomyces sp. NBC_00474]